MFFWDDTAFLPCNPRHLVSTFASAPFCSIDPFLLALSLGALVSVVAIKLGRVGEEGSGGEKGREKRRAGSTFCMAPVDIIINQRQSSLYDKEVITMMKANRQII